MTKVEILYEKSPGSTRRNIVGIRCKGHSNHKGDGSCDIVCTSVSLCMEILETGLRCFAPFEEAPEVSIVESRIPGEKCIRWNCGSKWSIGVSMLSITIAETMRSLASTYPENISVEYVMENEEEKGDKK